MLDVAPLMIEFIFHSGRLNVFAPQKARNFMLMKALRLECTQFVLVHVGPLMIVGRVHNGG